MIVIRKSSKYERARNKYLKNNPLRTEDLIKVIAKFANDPNHPSLNLEKLSGSKIWTIRINKSDRIFFHWLDKKTVLFIDIGKHDKYRNY